jgi:hypothetical protein
MGFMNQVRRNKAYIEERLSTLYPGLYSLTAVNPLTGAHEAIHEEHPRAPHTIVVDSDGVESEFFEAVLYTVDPVFRPFNHGEAAAGSFDVLRQTYNDPRTGELIAALDFHAAKGDRDDRWENLLNVWEYHNSNVPPARWDFTNVQHIAIDTMLPPAGIEYGLDLVHVDACYDEYAHARWLQAREHDRLALSWGTPWGFNPWIDVSPFYADCYLKEIKNAAGLTATNTYLRRKMMDLTGTEEIRGFIPDPSDPTGRTAIGFYDGLWACDSTVLHPTF